MHTESLRQWQHSHDFTVISRHGEKRTRWVLFLTASTMVAEIAAGIVFGSMALLADGWHMGTHAAAFLIAIFAYRYAKKNAGNPAFAFGTGKVSVLGGFASAVALASVALLMLIESVQRIFQPQTIHFNEAIGVACLGLAINVVSALLLQDHHHDHGHDHGHEHNEDGHAGHDDHGRHEDDHHRHGRRHDHNLRAAYLHVLADALTSVLAITALVFGKYLGWNWLDPLMGIVGAMVITRWSLTLLRETSPILLDGGMQASNLAAMRTAIEADSDNRVADIHVWRVGPADYAAIFSIVTHTPQPADHYKSLLHDFKEISHITIEIQACTDTPCLPLSR
jgi:cation diffusion facilitator family transporter